VKRVKHTVPPPNVCDGCWWRARYLASVEQLKELRRQAIRKMAARRVFVEKEAPADEPAKRDDPEVRDLVEEISRMRGE
jgi:hypothetical protein